MTATVFILAGLASVSPAFAFYPGAVLKGVEIQTTSGTASVYIFARSEDAADPKFLPVIRQTDALRYIAELAEIEFPSKQVISVGPGLQKMDARQIVAIKARPGPFDGRPGFYASVVSMSRRQAEKLRHKPLAMCRLYLYEEAEVFWLSYNAEVGIEMLRPFCEKEDSKRPTSADEKSFLKKSNVFKVVFPDG